MGVGFNFDDYAGISADLIVNHSFNEIGFSITIDNIILAILAMYGDSELDRRGMLFE